MIAFISTYLCGQVYKIKSGQDCFTESGQGCCTERQIYVKKVRCLTSTITIMTLRCNHENDVK